MSAANGAPFIMSAAYGAGYADYPTLGNPDRAMATSCSLYW